MGAGCGKGRETMNNKVNVYLPMYMSNLRHIHDPVLSSLKMEGIGFFFFFSAKQSAWSRVFSG
jgi:hypothetical protein